MKENDCISNSAVFRHLLKMKHHFIFPVTILFLSAYLLLPFLIIFLPGWITTPVIGPFTIAWLLAFAQFPIIWLVGLWYYKKAKYYDRLIEHIKQRRKLL